jgi:anhydro-N-acetylmuramic acid kinase
LLASLLSDAYFSKPPPKSTGRDLFNTPWLERILAQHPDIAAVDVQSTLTELTAAACANSLLDTSPASKTLIVCGGGALNLELMRRLQALLANCRVQSSNAQGLPPLQVEATAFAWLARQTLRRETASLKSVTGARGARILGAVYPA